MKYTSTRDASISCSFEEALCSGYAPDGGLFVPESLPSLSWETLQAWSSLSYPDLTFALLRLLIDVKEVDDAALRQICSSGLTGFVNPNQAVPVVPVGGLYVAELFHGPTFCFKDFGLRGLVNFLSYFASKRQRRMNLLVATTGDTGPAAVQAVSDVANPLLTLLVHYPEGQISNFQKRQLTTVSSPCVKVVAFVGSGDDMDLPIKNILRDPNRTTLVTGVNSYNIGRPLMQCVHYVWTYLRVAEALGLECDKDTTPVILDVVLPTGAMGNLVAGYMCKQMGLPLGKLSAGVNANDITYRVVQTGAFHRADTMHKTLSDAINIQVPYNFERLLFYLTGGGQQGLVKEWMQQMEETSRLDLPTEWLRKLQADFAAARVPDDAMCARLQKVWRDHQYLADPHTAVALDAAHQLGYTSATITPTTPVAILATASPCKFEESVTAAVGNQVWQQFLQGDFPPAAKTILERAAQVPPIHYAARESLEESQVAWEKQAREILEELQQL